MFTAEKVDDMFSDAPVGGPATGGLAPNRGLVDSYDDPEGYYNFQVPPLFVSLPLTLTHLSSFPLLVVVELLSDISSLAPVWD